MKTDLCIQIRCAKCGRLLGLKPGGPKDCPNKLPWAKVPNSMIPLEYFVDPCDHCDGMIQGFYARLKDALDSVDGTDGTDRTNETHGTDGTGGTDKTGGEG